jgi:hypothetical protein
MRQLSAYGGGGGAMPEIVIPITLTMDGQVLTRVVVRNMPCEVRLITGTRSM